MASTTISHASSSRHYSEKLSPHATSAPVPIPGPGHLPRKHIPFILRDDADRTPGLVHIPSKNITDFTVSHYPKMAKPSDEAFRHANPSRLGVPGFARPVVRRDVRIVPEEIPGGLNRREQNQWAWERLEKIRMIYASQRDGSGDRSEERRDSFVDPWADGGYSVWE